MKKYRIIRLIAVIYRVVYYEHVFFSEQYRISGLKNVFCTISVLNVSVCFGAVNNHGLEFNKKEPMRSQYCFKFNQRLKLPVLVVDSFISIELQVIKIEQ